LSKVCSVYTPIYTWNYRVGEREAEPSKIDTECYFYTREGNNGLVREQQNHPRLVHSATFIRGSVREITFYIQLQTFVIGNYGHFVYVHTKPVIIDVILNFTLVYKFS
jgi:hypothetical protein